MAAEAGLGEVAVGDGSVDADIGKSAGAPFGEGDGPAVPARGVFSTMAVPHALLLAAGWRGGTGVLLDRAVEHLPASHLIGPQRLGPELRSGVGSGGTGTWVR